MGRRVVDEKINITQLTPGVVATAVAAGDPLSECFAYSVPERSQVVINPSDWAGMVLQDGVGAIDADSRVVIQVADPMGRRTRVLADGEYVMFTELQDAALKFYFQQRVVIPANFQLRILVAPTTNGVAPANARFTVSCNLVYETLD